MFFYIVVFFSFFLFCLSFLEWDPLKSCIIMCMGIISMSFYVSLGVHVWYSYFIVLLFLSGIFSLLTYFCSLSFCVSNYNYRYFFFFLFFVVFFLFFFNYDFVSFFLDFNFLNIYYVFNFYYIFWIVFILFLLLSLISFSFGNGCYMRGF
uniref:NADH dehydrogenase subunit 6 n=1 Tax=Chandlerella quiscali TaxID=871019 RepID=E1AK26_9BILA|nr:NADH dehydrogenase subunit 6 [Chandlerella quiscali]ADL39027.1 NADH dehydrogenase subunit 6 [Chandlerella quiscali]